MKISRKRVIVASLLVLALVGIVIVGGCRRSMTTDTRSSSLPDDASKIAFLRKYLVMPSQVQATEFHIEYHDNDGGLVPGPSEWDMRVVMKVDPAKLPLWTDGFTPAEGADLSWGYTLLPSEKRWAIKSKPKVYQRGHAVVAIFETEGIVFKRVHAE